jgi:hypothetical protein
MNPAAFAGEFRAAAGGRLLFQSERPYDNDRGSDRAAATRRFPVNCLCEAG